jgi:glycosyltransferase involved in cell wall biosynthesis
MNILITPDVHEWAIGNLVKSIVKHLKRFNFFNVAVHPRGVAQGMIEIKSYLDSGIKFDLWHPQYWHAANQLMELMPELKEVPKLLTHHNHYQLDEADWKNYDALAIATSWGFEKLSQKHPKVIKVPMGIDLDRFSFIEDYNPEENTVGYIGRVVPHKNLDKICEVSRELGYKVIGSGYIDKPDYWEKVNKENLEFNGGFGRQGMMPQNFKDEIYRRMAEFVPYSTDEKETGTMPILEAMARGVPVLATAQGMARDLIKDGENGIIFTPENFKEKLKMLMEDKELRLRLRESAWKTIKGYPEQKMAYLFGRAYYNLIYPDKRLISVIVPTFNRAKNLLNVLLSIENQTYDAKEIIVCDDGSDDETELVVHEAKKQFHTPIAYFKTGTKLEYGLAKARNIGAIESMGEILLFLDDRLALKEDALENVAKYVFSNCWCYGGKMCKGVLSGKKSFIENFSWILRQDFIKGGMFSERMNMYGGLSQETRERYSRLGFDFKYIEEAKADEVEHSARNKKKEEIWKSKFLLYKMYGD